MTFQEGAPRTSDIVIGGGWRLPGLMTKMPAATGFSVDPTSRMSVDRCAEGRAARSRAVAGAQVAGWASRVMATMTAASAP